MGFRLGLMLTIFFSKPGPILSVCVGEAPAAKMQLCSVQILQKSIGAPLLGGAAIVKVRTILAS